MKEFTNISKEVEATLNSFDGIEKKETDPFFYTRLKQQLDNSMEVPGIIRWMTFAPIAKPVFIAALVIVNVITVWHYLNNNTSYETGLSANNNLIQLMNSDTTYSASNEMYLIFNDDE
jgi:hypothetical protein